MTMKAGKYYVGDLCYVLHEAWDEFCSLTIEGHKCLEGEFTLKDGRRFATYSTMHGDGVYRDQYKREYDVDAGLIGCILVDDINMTDPDSINYLTGGQIVDFPSDFTTRGGRSDMGQDWDGVIQFGSLYIETDSDGWDDEEY